MQETQDLYQTLQVNPTADHHAILAAYKTLALTYHPDRNAAPDACRLMTRLNQAFEILGAPTSRAAYDRQRVSWSGGWGLFGEADRLGRRRERFSRSGSASQAGPSRSNSRSYSRKRGFWSRWVPDIHAGIFGSPTPLSSSSPPENTVQARTARTVRRGAVLPAVTAPWS